MVRDSVLFDLCFQFILCSNVLFEPWSIVFFFCMADLLPNTVLNHSASYRGPSFVSYRLTYVLRTDVSFMPGADMVIHCNCYVTNTPDSLIIFCHLATLGHHIVHNSATRRPTCTVFWVQQTGARARFFSTK